MSNALEVLKRIVREEYKNIKDGVNIHPSGFRDYTPEEDSDFDEPHSTEKMESINERKLSSHQKKAILIAIEMSGNMTGAAKKIERIKKGLSNDKKVKDALRLANESVNEARSTNREWNKFEKAFGDFFTTVLRLGKANTKVTGDKTDEKIFIKNFNRDVGKFYSLMQSWVRGQNESVNEECCDNCKEGKTCCSVKEEKTMKITKTRIKEIIREEIQSVLTEGTRWLVGIEAPSGKIASTYGHYDGYPEHAGKMLKRYYSNTGKVKQLMKLGKQGISTIDKSIKGGKDHSFNNTKKGETVFYGRDRGEKSSMSSTWGNRDKVKFNSGEEFAYIWSAKDKKWYYKSRYSNPQDWTELK